VSTLNTQRFKITQTVTRFDEYKLYKIKLAQRLKPYHHLWRVNSADWASMQFETGAMF